MTCTDRVDAVVLAGDRGPEDPLAVTAQVQGKVLVPIGGKPMLTHVMHSLAALDGLDQVRLVCNPLPAYETAADVGLVYQRVDPAAGPAASLAAAFHDLSDDPNRAVLVLTGDHPLIQADWFQPLIERASAEPDVDLWVGVVDYHEVMHRFPGNRRTRYRFSDRSVCGTNLFLVTSARGRSIAETWQSFEQNRKQPWKIVARIGIGNLLRYLTGRLSLEQAFAALSRQIGVYARPVLLAWPEAAVDVDSPADLALVKTIFAERNRR